MTYLRPANAALAPTPAQLAADDSTKGYLASWDPTFNPLTYAWDANTSAAGPVIEAIADDGTGNRVRYVIHRLCANVGPLQGNNCVLAMDGQTLGAGGGGAGSSQIAPAPPSSYYRVTTRVDGPRNTVSYTQVVMR